MMAQSMRKPLDRAAQIREDLIERAMNEQLLAKRIVASGERHVGYNPQIEAVHSANADALDAVYAEFGWPGPARVGRDGAAAAMAILHNAHSRPSVQKRGLALMLDAIPQGEASPLEAAALSDRIAVYEGKPQLFGTQLDWTTEGRVAPAPLADPDSVDARRHGVGLGPLADSVRATEEAMAQAGIGPPRDLDERRAAFDAWAKRVGWRS
jgi:hypothetical protein